jgi:hypothetical protein
MNSTEQSEGDRPVLGGEGRQGRLEQLGSAVIIASTMVCLGEQKHRL